MRLCENCNEHVPAETTHYVLNDEVYCEDCVEVRPYTAYQYYAADNYMGDSEHSDGGLVESYDDLYEEEETK